MIKEFQGEYRFLSNFAKVDITIDGITYRSVEHAYMSQKSDDIEWKNFCKITESPAEVKKKSRKIKLVDNWDDIKIKVMRECIDQKFSREPYKTLLLETGDLHIQEGNRWKDKFWGVDLGTRVGRNILGKLIMGKRSRLNQEDK